MIAIALVAPTLAVYLLLRHRWNPGPAAVTPGLAAAAAPGLAFAASSCLYFGLLVLIGNHRTAVRLDLGFWLAADVGLLAATASHRSEPRRRFWPSPLAVARNQPDVIIAAMACLALLAVAGFSFWLDSTISPHGEWDAWAIWNVRARSIFRGVPDWPAIFSPAFPGAEYPPLLPVGVARLWAYAGRELPVAPITVAALFALSTVAVVVVSVGQLRGWASGWIAGTTLVAARTFVFQSSSQCADVPLGFFLLAAVLFIVMARESAQPATLLVAAGAAAAFGALTKNEGALLLIFALLAVGVVLRRPRAVALVAAGALMPAIALAYVKLHLTTSTNYLFGPEGTGALSAKLLDGARWAHVTGRLADMLAAWGGVPGGALVSLAAVVALTMRPTRPTVVRAGSALFTVAAMLFAYDLVYMLTPLNVEWQIAVSFDRLVTQLWPTLVWGAFQLSGTGPLEAVDVSTSPPDFA